MIIGIRMMRARLKHLPVQALCLGEFSASVVVERKFRSEFNLRHFSNRANMICRTDALRPHLVNLYYLPWVFPQLRATGR